MKNKKAGEKTEICLPIKNMSDGTLYIALLFFILSRRGFYTFLFTMPEWLFISINNKKGSGYAIA